MHKLLERCPACGGALYVSEMHCPNCDTHIRGRFAPGPLAALTDEQTTFVLLFLRCRGNMRELEKRLGVSYPTIRAKLDEVIATLERGEVKPALLDRRALLEEVASGRITPSEALRRLREGT